MVWVLKSLLLILNFLPVLCVKNYDDYVCAKLMFWFDITLSQTTDFYTLFNSKTLLTPISNLMKMAESFPNG